MKLSRDFSFVVFGGALAAAPFVCLIDGYSPTLPTPFFLAFASLGWLGVLVVLMLPVAFWTMAHQLRAGDSRIPRRSVVLFALALVLSFALTITGYSFASEWQGPTYARSVLAINLGMPLLLGALLWRNRSRAGSPHAFAFHWLLFAWLGSYAFAYMGETP